jgi:preprotein translocase subunit SecE
VARNRKRAKERRARRPQPVTARAERDGEIDPIRQAERDDTIDPIRHATPDVELAEAQMALGRPDLAEATAAGGFEIEAEDDVQAEPADAGGGRGRRRSGAGFDEGDAGDGGAAEGSAAALPAQRTRPGSRLVNFLQGSWRELQRVQWPDRRQVIQATGVVIGFVIVAGIYLGVADQLASKLMNWVLK